MSRRVIHLENPVYSKLFIFLTFTSMTAAASEPGELTFKDLRPSTHEQAERPSRPDPKPRERPSINVEKATSVEVGKDTRMGVGWNSQHGGPEVKLKHSF